MQKYFSAGSHEAVGPLPNVPSNSLIKKANMISDTLLHKCLCSDAVQGLTREGVLGSSGCLISVLTMQMFKYCWSLLQTPSLEIRGGVSGAV